MSYPGHRLIEKYVVWAILPYFLMGLLILTAVLLAQQEERFADILSATRAPLRLAGEMAVALLPNVLVFALPMALLTGTATGFSRLGSDSELVAMRAAGMGTRRLITPVLLLAALVTAATLYTGLELAPESARLLRQMILRATLYRLDSPVEPRSFNTEMPGKVVYVRDGDEQRGRWGRVFIYWAEPDDKARLVTALAGRIDTSGEQSELVLSDAVVTTLPSLLPSRGAPRAENTQVITEHSAQLRFRLNTGRSALVAQLRGRAPDPDELDWQELNARARSGAESERRAAVVARHKRLALCTAPLAFALCGVGLGLRARRGGRARGLFLSLAVMVGYYLVELIGDQLARTGVAPPVLGSWLATGATAGAGILLLAAGERKLTGSLLNLRPPAGRAKGRGLRPRLAPRARRHIFSGLLDRSVIGSVTVNFGLALATLAAVFLIFTLFELLRFIAVNSTSAGLVGRYLFFLLPLTIVALTPVAVLVATLTTYALMVRRSESVAWLACGQSAYRLAVPGVLFAAAVGGAGWGLQEKVLPGANRQQDALRAEIRGGVATAITPAGRQWLASPDTKRLYSYEYDAGSGSLKEPVVYEFDAGAVRLERVVAGRQGTWGSEGRLEIERPEVFEVATARGDGAAGAPGGRGEFPARIEEPETAELFKPSLKKPMQMSTRELSDYISLLKKRGEPLSSIRPLTVALKRKEADPFAALVMGLIGIPLALRFGRRSTITALCVAVCAGLSFWGLNSGFDQLGIYGILPPAIAVWAPHAIYAATGVYLLTRART